MKSSREGDIGTIFLVLRRLRRTLITLVVIFAVAVLGLTLVPGPPGPDGETTRMSFFHALYFVSYTATTIGFGEIPYSFSEQQRLWVLVCIYLSVIGWAIFISALLRIAQDDNLQQAFKRRRFFRDVRRLRQPFYLVCGFGETGQRICRALDRLGYRAVVLDIDPAKLADMELEPYQAEIFALEADAANPDTLTLAGLTHPHCLGVIALTNDDAANLAAAIAARLLAPELPVLARAELEETADNMASFGTGHIIHPFRKFGDYLSLAMHSPAAYHLLVWLTGLPGTTIHRHRDPPRGQWLLCGFGNFGRHLTDSIVREGLPLTVIDLHAADQQLAAEDNLRWVQGDGTGAAVLLQAGIRDAAGIIAATPSDVHNLSIAVTARQLNPDIFIILRQNAVVNRPLIEAFAADITMVPSEIIAQECLAILTTPTLAPFLKSLAGADEQWCESLLTLLTQRFGWDVPDVWGQCITPRQAPALYRQLGRGNGVTVNDLLRNPGDRSEPLRCQVLQVSRGIRQTHLLPDASFVLEPGDELLLVGTGKARRDLEFVLGNDHALQYVLTGRDIPGGWIWEKLTAARRGD